MHKIVLAVTGASGSIYPKQIIEKLLSIPDQWQELAVVMTDNAKQVWETELDNKDYERLLHDPAHHITTWSVKDFLAPFASGSGKFNTMIIAPCSMGTLGRIANGVSSDLITRAADVILKERRKLICLVRDTPYNLIHIRNMETLTLAGGIICPATPSFYSKPTTIEEVAATVTDRVLDLAGLDIKTFRWGSSE
ncbi:UbiX family flavin prenyltransferase [Pseudoflavitalea rhizosphaerae]|jgi:4-hydroxy-3-polyprenylbenzoate decarboxylase|uniref:UbiX family flavin prenyltransferase n=1 Tax=Pseudoflavitalea rhizosphaerae TaxID=1884793 RepID=UPI000F8D54B3|nr:UbiX family flavin prenyltransferase [Pseudoflavitalea rhizosphaerae]